MLHRLALDETICEEMDAEDVAVELVERPGPGLRVGDGADLRRGEQVRRGADRAVRDLG